MKRLVMLAIALATFAAMRAIAAAPPVYNIVMNAGEDYRLRLGLKSATGTALDLTGYGYAAQFRSAPAPAGTVFATYSCAVLAPATAGQIQCKLSAAQTAATSGKQGAWDLLQIEPDGLKSYILRGSAQVAPTATRTP